VDAFLSTLGNAGTARNYAGTLRALVTQLGTDTPLAVLASPLAGAEVSSWFERRWGERGAATWNRNLDTLRSAGRYWADQGWLETDLAKGLRRRKRLPDRTRALSRAEVETLLSRGDVALRDRTLWRMLYETAARISEVLSLDVG
jgi:integrase/recombinase XerC/integrase/recombinase XerD